MKFVQYNALNYYSANQQLAAIVSQSHLNAMYLKIVLLKAFAHSKYTHTGVFTSVPWLDLLCRHKSSTLLSPVVNAVQYKFHLYSCYW